VLEGILLLALDPRERFPPDQIAGLERVKNEGEVAAAA
jgi:hypothetical protein